MLSRLLCQVVQLVLTWLGADAAARIGSVIEIGERILLTAMRPEEAEALVGTAMEKMEARREQIMALLTEAAPGPTL